MQASFSLQSELGRFFWVSLRLAASVEVPTNLPVKRIDHNDSVYKTKREKLNAIVEDIVASHEKGQPVLVGTITIDASEELSQLLKKRGIPHKVLNAKFQIYKHIFIYTTISHKKYG